MQKIEITISVTGDVKVQTKGFSGSSCKTETAEFEKFAGLVMALIVTGKFTRH